MGHIQFYPRGMSKGAILRMLLRRSGPVYGMLSWVVLSLCLSLCVALWCVILWPSEPQNWLDAFRFTGACLLCVFIWPVRIRPV